MPKERKGSAVTGNGFDPVSAKRWQGEFEKHQERLLELKMAYMTDCKAVRGNMKDVLELAKDAGIPKSHIKDTAKIRELKQRIDNIENGGESEDIESLEQFRLALGDLDDLPLGQAATAAKAKGMPGATAAH